MALKVIGSGFGRTGTASLKVALEQLMGGACFHMSELLGKPGQVDLWLDAAAGNPDWDAIFEGFVATVDYPASNYWRELAAHYPDAKIVHSVRDPERWFTSTQETIFSKTMRDLQQGTKWGRMMVETVNKYVGGDLTDKAALIAAFNDHTRALRETFGPDRLLVFEAKQGWEPLCAFLGVPVPAEPYPYINSKEEFAGIFEMLGSPIGAKAMNGEGIATDTVHEDFFEKE